MRSALIAAFALLSLVACGPGRCPDPNNCFTSIVQFSAVTKLQVSSGFVYFHEAGGFERVSVDGGTIENLLTDETVHDFAVTSGFAYVATDTGLVRLDTTNTTGQHQQLSTDKTVGVAADANGVAWLSCASLNQSNLDGSARTQTKLDSCSDPSVLAIDSSTVYGSAASGNWYASRSGGALTLFGSEPCKRVLAGGGWMYCNPNTGGLERIDPLSGEVQDLMQGDVHDFALSPANLYVATGTDLDAQPRGSGNGSILGTYANISSVAVDDKVYFVNTQADLGLLLSTPL